MPILKLSNPDNRIRTASVYPAPISADIPLTANNAFLSSSATTNFNNIIRVGESNAAAAIYRSWIQPDYSSIPSSAQAYILTAILKMTPITDNSDNARTMSAHRCLRAVNTSQATWNIFSTGNNWGTAGASNSTTDYEGGVTLGTQTQPASPTLNSADSFQMTLLASEIRKFHDGTYTNNGIILFVATQTNDLIEYADRSNATVEYRPKLTVTYLPL